MKRINILTAIFFAAILAGCGAANNGSQPVAEYTGGDIEIIDFDEDVQDNNETEIEYEPLTNLVSTGFIYYKGNPEEYNKPAECSIEFGQASSLSDGDKKIVTIPVKLIIKGEYTEDCIDYSGCITPAVTFCDMATGVLIDSEPVEGEDGYVVSGTIVSDESSVYVSVECQVSISEDNWTQADTGFTKNMVFETVYNITVPTDYNGLGLKITPVRSYSEFMSMSDLMGTHDRDYLPEGTKLYKISTGDGS